ncbi:MAG: hypothetical protein V4719_14760 [Planctomycetota bacterium]
MHFQRLAACWLIAAMSLLVLIAGCKKTPTALSKDIQSLMNRAESVELFSLDPYTKDNELENFNEEEMSASKFHGWAVYGSRKLTDEVGKNLVRAAILDSTPDIHPQTAMACFWPHHGVRFTAGDKHVEFVICFFCESMKIWEATGQSSMHTTSTGKSVLNRLIKEKGIHIAPKP